MIDVSQTEPESSKLGICSDENAPEVWNYLQSEGFLKQLPEDLRFAWGVQEVENHQTLFALKQPGKTFVGPDQSDIQDVVIQKEANNEKGADEWETLTGKNVDRNIAIVIEGKVYAAPTVREKIKQGKCVISGRFSKSEASGLRDMLLKPTG